MTRDPNERQKVETVLESVRTAIGALLAVAVRPKPWLEVRTGVLHDDADQGLSSSLFGGKDEVERLANALDNRDPKLLPELWGQGELICVVDTNHKGWYCGFFFVKREDVLEDAKRSKSVSTEFRKAFAKMK